MKSRVFCISLVIFSATISTTTTTTAGRDFLPAEEPVMEVDSEIEALEDRYLGEVERLDTPIADGREFEARVEEILAMICQVCRRKKNRRCIIRYCTSDALTSVVEETHDPEIIITDNLGDFLQV